MRKEGGRERQGVSFHDEFWAWLAGSMQGMGCQMGRRWLQGGRVAQQETGGWKMRLRRAQGWLQYAAMDCQACERMYG